MKKLLLILVTVFTLLSCNTIKDDEVQSRYNRGTGYYEYNVKGNKFIVSFELKEHVDDFIDDLYKYDINLDNMFSGFLGIVVDRPNQGHAGTTYTSYDGQVVSLIDEDILSNYYKTRATVYHELGHAGGLKHCHNSCYELMARSIHMFNTYGDWDRLVRIMFNQEPHLGFDGN